MCVCGRGSWRRVIGRVGNAMESNLQQISHGPFGVQELLRKRERGKERERREKRKGHYSHVFSLDQNNNQEVTKHATRGSGLMFQVICLQSALEQVSAPF